LIISKVNFEGNGGKMAKTKKHEKKRKKKLDKKTKRVRGKTPLDINFQGKFSRQRKET
jgi:hypothetical protein